MSVDLQKIVDLTGIIPFDNIDNSKVLIESFCSENIAVVTTNKATNIIHGMHSHDSYEFVITFTDMPSSLVDNKVYDRKYNTLFAINPMQEHGLAEDQEGFSLCGVHIEKSLLQSVSTSLFGSSNIQFSNDSFIVNHDIISLIYLFLDELKYKQIGHEFMIENLSLLIAGNLIRQIKNNLQTEQEYIYKGNKGRIKKVIDYMNENFATGISCTELSKLINMDKFNFIRSFKLQMNKTPYEYILDLKIEKAKRLLNMNNLTVTEISMMCGFSSHSHFTSTFKKKTGLSPTEYKFKSCL